MTGRCSAKEKNLTMTKPIKFAGTPGPAPLASPTFGQHSDEVLAARLSCQRHRIPARARHLSRFDQVRPVYSRPCRIPVVEDAMTDDVASTADLFEIIRTTRSMRRLKQDPVPDALIRKVLEAGVCAPSGGNMQRWRFLVIRDATIKRTVGAYYKRAWDEVVAPRYRAGQPAPGMDRERFLRLLAAAEHLAAHIHEAPVWIVPCLQGEAPTRTAGSSIYPAVQNMLLAARALGLGATLTTLYLSFEKEAEAALGLPADWHSYAILPIGYPTGRFGPVRRVALADVVFRDRWGEAFPLTAREG